MSYQQPFGAYFQPGQQQQGYQEQQAFQQFVANPQTSSAAAAQAVATITPAAPAPVPTAPHRPFDPTDHDLDANFRLTSFCGLKG